MCRRVAKMRAHLRLSRLPVSRMLALRAGGRSSCLQCIAAHEWLSAQCADWLTVRGPPLALRGSPHPAEVLARLQGRPQQPRGSPGAAAAHPWYLPRLQTVPAGAGRCCRPACRPRAVARGGRPPGPAPLIAPPAGSTAAPARAPEEALCDGSKLTRSRSVPRTQRRVDCKAPSLQLLLAASPSPLPRTPYLQDPTEQGEAELHAREPRHTGPGAVTSAAARGVLGHCGGWLVALRLRRRCADWSRLEVK